MAENADAVIDQFLSEFLVTAGNAAGSQAKPVPTRLPPARAGPRQLARALSKFDSEQESELSLSEGDIVVVEDQREDGWWLGLCNGKRSGAAIPIFPKFLIIIGL